MQRKQTRYLVRSAFVDMRASVFSGDALRAEARSSSGIRDVSVEFGHV